MARGAQPPAMRFSEQSVMNLDPSRPTKLGCMQDGKRLQLPPPPSPRPPSPSPRFPAPTLTAEEAPGSSTGSALPMWAIIAIAAGGGALLLAALVAAAVVIRRRRSNAARAGVQPTDGPKHHAAAQKVIAAHKPSTRILQRVIAATHMDDGHAGRSCPCFLNNAAAAACAAGGGA